MRNQVKRWIGPRLRSALERRGYYLWHQKSMRFGIDPIRDVRILSERLQRPITLCLDVGANVGQTTHALLDAFPKAIVHAFEPVEPTFAKLRSALGSHPRVELHRLAMSDLSGKMPIHVYDSSLLSSLREDAPYAKGLGVTAEVQLCRVETIDSFCASNGIDSIGLLKIDTEGNDVKVLHGARKMLEKVVDFALVEFNAYGKVGDRPNLDELQSVFAPLGYRCIATYCDEVHIDMDWLLIANALFARPAARDGPQIEQRGKLGSP